MFVMTELQFGCFAIYADVYEEKNKSCLVMQNFVLLQQINNLFCFY